MITNKIAYFDPEIGEFVYEWCELPDGWDMTEDEYNQLMAEWNACIGWSDCR